MSRSAERLENLVQGVVIWAREKGIVYTDCAMPQWHKMNEEVQELKAEIFLQDKAGIADELGDVLVTCIVQADIQGLDVATVLEAAYRKISKRKGRLIDGQFVKDEVAHDAG